MPFDANKAAHVAALVQRSFQGRQRSVVFVYQSGSSFSYVAQSVIWRPGHRLDPQVPDLAGSAPRADFDTLVIAPLSLNMTGVSLVADTGTASAGAVAAAAKYQVVEVVPSGIIAGGSHLVIRLRRAQ
jgi:hypothetical protein